MENNNNYVDKYERILAERRQRLRYLADKIQLFDSEVCIPRQLSSTIAPEPPKNTVKEKENIPTPKKSTYNGKIYGPSQFITPCGTKTPQLSKTHSNLCEKFEHKTPPRDEIGPLKGNVAQRILNLEALEALKNNYMFKKSSKPDYAFTKTITPPKIVQTEPQVEKESELEEDSESIVSNYENYETTSIIDEMSMEVTSEIVQNSDENTFSEICVNESCSTISTVATPRKSVYKTVQSSNVTEFQMLPGSPSKLQRMSTKYDSVDDKDDLDLKILSKFPSIYPTPESLVDDLLANTELIKSESSVVLNTLHSETRLSEAQLKSSLLVEEAVIQQVMKALRLYSSSHKQQFCQSSLHAECSRLLLIATQRKASILCELKNQMGSVVKKSLLCFLIKMDCIRLQLKLGLVGKSEETHYFVCLLKQGHRIVSTQLRSSTDFVGHSSIMFADVFHLSNLPVDFKLIFEVHYMSIQIPNNFIRKMTPRKFIDRKDFAVKPFIALGSVVLSAFDSGRRFAQIPTVPSSCVLDGGIRFNFDCSIISSKVVRCFMTFREETSSWDRRWCLLCEGILKMWHYPDDETNSRIPIRRVDLIKSLEGAPRLIQCDECPRPYTFEMRLREGTVIKSCLVSADSNDVMVEMFHLLNALYSAVSILTRR